MKATTSSNLKDRLRLVYGLLGDGHYGKILEIGCASGYFSRILRDFTDHLVSIDINPVFVKEARKGSKDIEFHVCPAEKLDFRQKGFDVVIFLDVLEHTVDPVEAIAQIRKKMKKGGKLYLSVPQKGWFEGLDVDNAKRAAIRYWPGFYRGFYRILTGKKTDRVKIPPQHRHYSLKEIADLLGQGFRIERYYQQGLFLYPFGLLIDPLIKRVPLLGNGLHILLNWLMDLDFKVGYGSASYNLLVVAAKK